MPRVGRSGMPGFILVWLGQVVSLLGSGMTQFALTIWAWQITGEATALAMVAFFGFFPRILLTPLAGALIDRWNRKLVMILSDLAAGIGTIVVLLLLRLELLQIWHLYAVAAFSGAFGSFQAPAFTASISLMLPKKHFTRANTMLGLGHSISTVFAPMAAGALLAFIGIHNILLIDIATFTFAVLVLLVVPIPQPDPSAEDRGRSLLSDCLFGFKYIFANRSLLGLVGYTFVVLFLLRACIGVVSPMILARTGGNELALGTVLMLFGIGGIVGGSAVSIWGGPKRKVRALFLSFSVSLLLGKVVLGIGQGLVIWGIGAFLSTVLLPLSNGARHAIWQAKVAPRVQGRVFSARILIGQLGGALALPVAGLLADRVFEPLMSGSSRLAQALSHIVGSGPGAGMGLMYVLFGSLGVVATVLAFSYRPVRDIEQLLPDHDTET